MKLPLLMFLGFLCFISISVMHNSGIHYDIFTYVYNTLSSYSPSHSSQVPLPPLFDSFYFSPPSSALSLSLSLCARMSGYEVWLLKGACVRGY